MRPDRVIDAIPARELRVEFLRSPSAVIDLRVLLAMGAVDSLYGPIEFGAFGAEARRVGCGYAPRLSRPEHRP